LACHLQIDADPDLIPDPAFHFGADLDLYLVRIRMQIQVTKMMDPCGSRSTTLVVSLKYFALSNNTFIIGSPHPDPFR
jgi:hypothetical protein